MVETELSPLRLTGKMWSALFLFFRKELFNISGGLTDKFFCIKVIVLYCLMHGKTVRKKEKKPGKIFAWNLVCTFWNFFGDQRSETLIAAYQMSPYFLIADHSIIKKRQAEFDTGYVAFQNITDKTVKGSIFICIVCPLTKLCPLLVQIFVCDRK